MFLRILLHFKEFHAPITKLQFDYHKTSTLATPSGNAKQTSSDSWIQQLRGVVTDNIQYVEDDRVFFHANMCSLEALQSCRLASNINTWSYW